MKATKTRNSARADFVRKVIEERKAAETTKQAAEVEQRRAMLREICRLSDELKAANSAVSLLPDPLKVAALIQTLEDYEAYRSSILATLQSHGASAVLTSGVLDLVWAYGDKARAALFSFQA